MVIIYYDSQKLNRLSISNWIGKKIGHMTN